MNLYYLIDRTHPSYSADRAVLLAAFKKEYPTNNLSENIAADGKRSLIKAPKVGQLDSELEVFEEAPTQLVTDPSWVGEDSTGVD